MPRGRQSAEPLWRAIAVFRFAGLGYAVLLAAFIDRADYSRLDWAWAVIAVMTAWTVGTAMAYARPERSLGAEPVPREDYPPLLGHPAERIALPSQPRPARRLAARHGLRLYATDDVMADHGRRSSPVDSPFMARFAAMGMDERWVSRSPQTMLETFGWFRGEGFGLIVEDLLRRPAGPGVIAEGFRLLPRLVRPLLAAPGHAVWLCPTPGFRRAAFASRGSLLRIAGKTSDPDTALANLLERDQMFTDRLREEATGLGLPVIDVDTTMTEDELAGRVARAFGLVRAR